MWPSRRSVLWMKIEDVPSSGLTKPCVLVNTSTTPVKRADCAFEAEMIADASRVEMPRDS